MNNIQAWVEYYNEEEKIFKRKPIYNKDMVIDLYKEGFIHCKYCNALMSQDFSITIHFPILPDITDFSLYPRKWEQRQKILNQPTITYTKKICNECYKNYKEGKIKIQ